MGNKIVLLLMVVIVLGLCIPFLIDSVTDFQTESFIETEDSVTTAAGVTSANLTLTNALFEDDIRNVTSITSNETELATLTPSAYVAASRQLTVDGLVANDTRSLTLTYDTDALDDVAGLPAFVAFWPLWMVAGGGFIVYRFLVKR